MGRADLLMIGSGILGSAVARVDHTGSPTACDPVTAQHVLRVATAPFAPSVPGRHVLDVLGSITAVRAARGALRRLEHHA